jgi:hypothetical protein
MIEKCRCRKCIDENNKDSVYSEDIFIGFIVCSECGNKRCPHANDHLNICTKSNEMGQEGSAYK